MDVHRLLPLVLIACAHARAVAPAVALAQGGGVEIAVAATTDLHGRLRGWDYFADTAESARGLSRVATIIDSLRQARPYGTILVDAGDFLQGNALTYVASKPAARGTHPVIAAMNAMAYDAVVLGNHEFNYGLDFLDRAIAGARFPVLAANAVRLDAKGPFGETTIVERMGGVRVAIIGVTNPWAKVWDRSILAGKVEIEDIVVSLKRAVAKARAQRVDAVVVVAHAGLDQPPGAEEELPGVGRENPMSTVAREVPGIDLIVFGHSHREVADTTINGVLMMQPRNWATSLAVATLRFERQAQKWVLSGKRGQIVRATGHAEQPALVAQVEAAHQAGRAYATSVVGRTAVEWRSDSARTTDVPITDFVGETMRRATGAELASTAVFSVGLRIPPGPVTVAQLAQLYPYDNTIRMVRLTGTQLKAFLEQSARYFRVTGSGDSVRVRPEPTIPGFNFEVVTGATYEIDLARPAGDRITGLAVRGRAVVPTDTFSIALTNYRAGGAGGYGMIAGAPVINDDQREIRQLLIDEVTKRGDLKPSDYFTSSWRVVPASLAAAAQAAIRGEVDFDATVRPRPATPPPAAPTLPPTAAQGRAGAKASVVRVISTNDFHGAFEARPDGNAGRRGGAAHMAAVIRRLERECTGRCTSVLVDGGDQFQGTPASNLAYGRPVVALYNAIGYAATAIGNHEFDWGQDTLRARMREARYGMFAANITDLNGRPVPWIRPDTIVERGGVKIGIIGVSTVITPNSSKPENLAGLKFLQPGPVVVERARSLRARGAEFVMVVAHAGASCAETCTGEMGDVAALASRDVDAIVGGHNHIEMAAVTGTLPMLRSRSSARAVAYVDVPLDRAARSALAPKIMFVATDSITPDPEIARIVAAALAPVSALVNRAVATVPAELRRTGEQYALGNFIADAQRAAANSDIAVMNNGGIRTDLRAGPATYGTFFELSPFGNVLVRLTVTGAELAGYLERVVSRNALNAHISGAIVRFDPSRPAGSRVLSVTIGGATLNPSSTYTISMSDFMVTGGDGLSLSGPAQSTEMLGIVDLDALVAYARAQPGGIVRADAEPRLISIRP